LAAARRNAVSDAAIDRVAELIRTAAERVSREDDAR